MDTINIRDYLDQIGAFLILIVFWGGSFTNIFYRERAMQFLESKGYTENASLILSIAILWQVVGSILVLNPVTMDYGCILLIVFTMLSSLQFYQFWKMRGVERYINMIFFLSNVGIIGGLLLLLDQSQRHHYPFNWILSQ